jgi:hypothetical protein
MHFNIKITYIIFIKFTLKKIFNFIKLIYHYYYFNIYPRLLYKKTF